MNTGRDSGWKTQSRDAEGTDLRVLWREHRGHMACGVILAGAAYFDSPGLVLWLAPAIVGLVLAVPLAAAAGSVSLGERLRRRGILNVAEESAVPEVMKTSAALRPIYADIATRAPDLSGMIRDER